MVCFQLKADYKKKKKKHVKTYTSSGTLEDGRTKSDSWNIPECDVSKFNRQMRKIMLKKDVLNSWS